MKHTIIYVGLDVDDTSYHGAALDKTSGELMTFKCRPTLKALLSQLDKLRQHLTLGKYSVYSSILLNSGWMMLRISIQRMSDNHLN